MTSSNDFDFKQTQFPFCFAFKMIPRRQGGGDAGVHFTYSEELTTKPKMGFLDACFAPQAEGEETKGALECKTESHPAAPWP